MSAAGSSVELEGIVCAGLGEGVRFTALPWVQAEFRRKLGFVPWPGTLNLQMSGTAWDGWRCRTGERAGVTIEPPPGYCAALCFEATVGASGLRAVAVLPQLAGYPPDKLELLAALELRAALALADGDRLRLRLPA